MSRLPLPKLLFAVFLLMLTGKNVKCQNTYRFRHLGVEQGLSQGSIYSMLKDSRGFLWLGTEDGINRFDGKNIQVFLSGSTGESTNVLGIAEDNLADLWVGSHKGLYKYLRRYNRFLRPAFAKKLENLSVHVFSDHKKQIYFLSEIGLYRLDNNTLQLITKDFAYNRAQYNNFLTETPDGDLWLIGPEMGLSRLSLATKKVTHYFSGHAGNVFGERQIFNCLGIDRSGGLWLASRKGLMKFDYLKNSLHTFNMEFNFKQHAPTDIESDHKGLIWLATEGSGILIFDPKKGKRIQHLKHEDDVQNSLRFNEVSTIYIDEDNDIFVNTDPQGLDIITGVSSAFNFYTYGRDPEFNLSDYSARGIEEDSDSSIWIGTELGGINRLDPKSGLVKHYTLNDGLPGNTIRYILKDPENRIWVASVNGLSVFIPEQNRFKAIGLPLSCEITNILSLGTGLLLLSSNKGLMLLNTGTEKVIDYIYPNLVAGYGSYWDNATHLAYVSNRYRGVNVFLINNDKPVIKSKILENFHVLQIYHQPRSPFLWACTDTGLVKWNLKENRLAKNYRVTDGLHHEYLYCLLPDFSGRFWISTNHGITRFDPKAETFEFIKEIPPREYNSRSALAARNGSLYFGNTSGMDVIKPQLLTLQNNHVGVQLTDLIYDSPLTDDDSLYIGERQALKLPYSNNTFTLRFTATDFRSNGLNRFRYFLKGYDKDTIFAGNVDQVRYARLPAGAYEFQLQASDLGGNWVSPVRKLVIVISPPFWQTWWFISLLTILIISLIYLSIKNYLNSRLTAQRLESDRKISLEKERSRIARDMNDSLGSELFGLKLLGQVALSQNKSEDSDSYLQKIVTISKSISEKISEVIWLTDSNQDNAESLWSYIQKNAIIYLKPYGINYHFDMLQENHSFLISGERRHEILNFHKQLFLELSNVLDASQIEIRFKIFSNHLLITIKNANLLHADKTLLISLTRLRGSRISDSDEGEILNIPLTD